MSKELNNFVKDNKDKTNKLKILKILILTPNFNKTYYVETIINKGKPLKSKEFTFNDNNNNCIINQVFEIDKNMIDFDSIKFDLYEKNKIFSKPLFKGEVLNNNFLKDNDNNNYYCELKNNDGKNVALLYYSFELTINDLFMKFNLNKKNIEKQNENNFLFYLKNKNELINNSDEIFKIFIYNLDYLKYFLLYIENIIKWRNKWKTLQYLFLITIIILKFKFIFIFILPLFGILYHLMFKDKIEYFLIIKTNQNKDENLKLFYKILEMFNNFINLYEDFTQNVILGEKNIIEELYKEMIKLLFFNFVLFYSNILILFNFKLIFIIIIWYIFLIHNPSFNSFKNFMISLILEKAIILQKKIFIFNFVFLCIKKLLIIIPFYSLYELYLINNEEIKFNSLVSSIGTSNLSSMKEKNKNLSENKTSSNEIIKLLKFELYENERWWIFVGWTKKMIMNEIPIWCKVENLKKYCNKDMIFLPINNDIKYQWSGEWKIDFTENTDELGWEYSSDFKSKFVKFEDGKYVRRRKWVRYANKI